MNSLPSLVQEDGIFKRANKNRPREMSSKKPVTQFMDVFQVKKKHHRDPRFDDLSGVFDKEAFEENYSWVKEIRAKEKEQLEKELEETSGKRKKQIMFLLRRMKNQECTEKLKEAKRIQEIQRKEEAIKALKEGKKPFFIKKSEKRKQELSEKFDELKKSGKLQKYLERKRKKAFAKDKKCFNK